MTSERRWVDDEGTVWFELETGGALEPEEALRNHVDNQYFEDAYEALRALIIYVGMCRECRGTDLPLVWQNVCRSCRGASTVVYNYTEYQRQADSDYDGS